MSFSSYSTDDESGSYPEEEHFPPAASGAATLTFLGGLALAYVSFPSQDLPAMMARSAAIPTGIALAISIYFDSRRGVRNLFRTDLLCLISLYFLTLAEFLFPQKDFNDLLTVAQTRNGLTIILLGMACLAIGRHLVKPQAMRSPWLNFSDVSINLLFAVVMLAAFLGFLHMLMAVQFNPMAMIEGMMGPRFSEPWGRNRLGDASSLLTELGLFRNAVPPLSAVLLNRRHLLPFYKVAMVVAVLALTMFQGFAGGTRNVFAAYLATFIVGYLLTLPRYTIINTIVPILLTGFVMVYGSYHMLEFRTIGLQNYLENKVYAGDTVRETLAVDYNLTAISLLPDAMPDPHPFLGSEIVIWAIARPFPRVLFPGKPEGLSITVEEIVGADGWTVAVTYLGEAFMMAGYWGVIVTSLFLGALAAWWNRLVLQRQSDYAMVVYALGFFAGSITMRSMFWLTTAMLPVIGLIVARKSGLIR